MSHVKRLPPHACHVFRVRSDHPQTGLQCSGQVRLKVEFLPLIPRRFAVGHVVSQYLVARPGTVQRTFRSVVIPAMITSLPKGKALAHQRRKAGKRNRPSAARSWRKLARFREPVAFRYLSMAAFIGARQYFPCRVVVFPFDRKSQIPSQHRLIIENFPVVSLRHHSPMSNPKRDLSVDLTVLLRRDSQMPNR